jgi:hypothetical protein
MKKDKSTLVGAIFLIVFLVLFILCDTHADYLRNKELTESSQKVQAIQSDIWYNEI